MHEVKTAPTTNTVFFLSLAIVVVLVVFGILMPQDMERITTAVHSGIIEQFGWAYLLSAFGFLVFCIWIALSRYGKIRLGKDHERPQYSYFGWFSMLFAAGMGIGLIFWGVAEPLSHFADPPAFLEPKTAGAAQFAMTYSFFHWGLHPWAIYIVMSLSIAYFTFRRGMPPLISSCFYPLIGDRIFGIAGRAIDILAVFATVFGVATSLGLGAMQIAGGLSHVLPIASGTTAILIIIAVVTVLYLISSMTGLDTGIQILSRANVLIAVGIVSFILVFGSSASILNVFTTTLGDYFSQLLPISLSTNPFEGAAWTRSWTLFYWAWWISWSPFVGLFVASISRGRTIREFVLGALLVPTLLTFVWFSVFGGSALIIEMTQGVELSAIALEDPSRVLFVMLEYLPMTGFLSLVAVLLLSVFFITSADSATFVLAMMTSNGNLNPSNHRKLIWGIVQSSAAAMLLLSGGLEALQRMAIVAALPFMGVMLLLMVSVVRALRYELQQSGG